MYQLVLLLALLLSANSFLSPGLRGVQSSGALQLQRKNTLNVVGNAVGLRRSGPTRLFSAAPTATGNTAAIAPKTKKIGNLGLRWITGLTLGAVCSAWIFSSKIMFTFAFLFPIAAASEEYYKMVRATGTEPMRKTCLAMSIACFLLAAFAPQFHELVMPISSTLIMLYLLVAKQRSPSINEIATSLWGVFYLGYLPSFWIRLKGFQGLGAGSAITLPGFLQQFGAQWDYNSIALWVTWTSIVMSDVGAYFAGKNFGKTKLHRISKAAGAASPNKTVEGFFGGIAGASVISVLGAKVLGWPQPYVSGVVYAGMLSFLGLVGDLTASMMKRDADMKDSGKILPGHGGLLDRIDSYMFNAHAAFIFITLVLPAWAKRVLVV